MRQRYGLWALPWSRREGITDISWYVNLTTRGKNLEWRRRKAKDTRESRAPGEHEMQVVQRGDYWQIFGVSGSVLGLVELRGLTDRDRKPLQFHSWTPKSSSDIRNLPLSNCNPSSSHTNPPWRVRSIPGVKSWWFDNLLHGHGHIMPKSLVYFFLSPQCAVLTHLKYRRYPNRRYYIPSDRANSSF